MGKFNRFARQFGRACGDYNLILPADIILLPLDTTYDSLALLHWIHYKSTKTPQHFEIIPIYFYCTDEPNDFAQNFLIDFCSKKNLQLQSRKIPKQNSHFSLLSLYANCCLELKCNKFAVSDCLDDLDSILLSNMATFGTSDIPNVIQQAIPGVFIIRPFAYLSKKEIEDFGSKNNFPNEISGQIIPNDPAIEIAKSALYHMADGNCNALFNVFHSLFDVRHLYLGVGTGQISKDDDDEL